MSLQCESWRSVAAELGVEIIAPVELTVDGTHMRFTALLPQFGGPAGIVVDPNWSTIEPYADALVKAGYGYSCVSINGSTPDGVRDCLLDWGWNGSTDQKPRWL